MIAPKSFYQENIQAFSSNLSEIRKKDLRFSLFRFSLILVSAFFGYQYLKEYEPWWLLAMLAGIVAFTAALFAHLRLRKLKRRTQAIKQVNEDELQYLGGNLSAFDNGAEFKNSQHLFSNDLDLFGPHSLFSHLNRTSTLGGKQLLYSELVEPKLQDVEAKQAAIHELAMKPKWRQKFAAIGKEVEENEQAAKVLKYWLETDGQSKWLGSKWLLYVLALLSSGLLIHWMIQPTIQNFNWFTYAFGLNLLLVFSQFKVIKKEYELLNKVSKTLGMYSELLGMIEELKVESSYLIQQKEKLELESQKVSTALKKLSRLMDGFDQLNNVVALVLTNGLYHYHLHVLNGLYDWKRTFGTKVFSWIEVLSEIDYLNSLANFNFNNQDFVYPKLSTSPVFKASQLGHPLINSTKRVDNDIAFDEFNFVVLTGSNMSGKSTFLRSMGVNLILAKMGAPVCARQMEFYPFRLLSSMKLADSLDRDESYFQAEVIRLRSIKEVLETNERCLLLLDEILRGTNSDDKRKGTRLFMEKVAQYNSIGVVATHDIDIAELASQQKGVFNAKYFESKVVGGELHFDYHLRDGICTTPNATELMRRNGII